MGVRRMVRGKKETGPRGSEGSRGRGVRGSKDGRLDPVDLEHDPDRHLRDDDEDLPDPANDEYVWPRFEEEEDD